MQYDWRMTRLLKLRDLYIYFSSHEAVRGIHFDIDDGEVLGLGGRVGLRQKRNGSCADGLVGGGGT